MLEILKIKNVAIIDSAEVRFTPGLNILSGETGAGKSIIIEAISLLLGSRASVELIRTGADEAIVEGFFKISGMPWMTVRLNQAGFDPRDGELLIKRTVHRAGRHRISINGELATLNTLQGLCEGLIDLCGQNEHQSLLKTPTQLGLLDEYSNLSGSTRDFSLQFQKLRALIHHRDELEKSNHERTSKSAFLKYQIDEILQANLKCGEDETLQLEKQLLQSAEVRAQTTAGILQIFEAEDHGVQNKVRAALQKTRTLIHLDPSNQVLSETLIRITAEIEEVIHYLNRYSNMINLDSEKLQMIQDRLSLLAELKRKYGIKIKDILEKLTQFQNEFQKLGSIGDQLDEVTKEIGRSQSLLLQVGQALSTSRKKAASQLSSSVTRELKDLKMGEAQLIVEIKSKENFSDWTSSGGDQIQFLVQTNRGEPARPIGKIASGGELSRLMLSIRRVIADRGGIGVYLFDEIDAGIGGQTAFQVGKKLKSVAQYNQVICITHLPQVASFADHHLIIRKDSQMDRTTAQIVELSRSERQEEIARMLGGPLLTRKNLENASELLELAGN
jgi:DNA repair protein RecN (Recombination protein N)